MQRRIERIWGGRVIELYGSTETMLLGTGCRARSLHLEPDLAHCEVLHPDSDEEIGVGEEGRLIVTTLGIEGSPLVRLDTGDRVRRLPACGMRRPPPSDRRAGSRERRRRAPGSTAPLLRSRRGGRRSCGCARQLGVLHGRPPDRLVIRIESERESGDPHEAARKHLGDVNVEIETTKQNQLLDVEQLSRKPQRLQTGVGERLAAAGKAHSLGQFKVLD